MATVKSQQITRAEEGSSANPRNYPIDTHGKLRIAYFYYKNETGGTLAAATEIDLCDLPFGRIRILPHLCRYFVSAGGAGRTLDIGHRAYYPSNNPGDVEAEDPDAFVDGDDVENAVANEPFATAAAAGPKFDIYSRAGVRLFATWIGDTMPANAVIHGYVVYVAE